MAFDLNIYFTGLCVFVPKGDRSQVDVLLIDTKNSGTDDKRNSGKKDAKQKEHVAVVQYNIRNRKSDLPNYPLFQDSEGEIKGLWLLDQERLSFENDDKFFPGKLDIDLDEVTGYPETKVDARSFNWIAPLCDKNGKIYKIDMKKLNNGIEGSGLNLLARMSLRSGSLRPACFSVDPVTNKFFIWEFMDRLQAVASVVLLKLRVDSDEVCLVAEKFKKQKPGIKRYLSLGPDPERQMDGISDPVEIWIMNREFDAICNQSAPGEKEFGLGNEESEFEHFRDALKGNVGEGVGGKNPVPKHTRGCAGNLNLDGCLDVAMRKIYFPLCSGEKWPSGNCPPSRAEDSSPENSLITVKLNNEKKTFARLRLSYRNVLDKLKDHHSIAAIDIGAIEPKDDSENLAVRVHITKALSQEEQAVVEEFGAVVISPVADSEDVPKAKIKKNPEKKNLIQPGESIGRKDRNSGTLGAIVKDRVTGKLGVLSCWHVLAHSRASDGDRIIQPGVSEGGHIHEDWVASLASMKRMPRPDRDGDAAFAIFRDSLDKDLEAKQQGLDVVVENVKKVALEHVGETVVKSGRATGVTRGRIDGIGTYFVTFEDSIGRVGVEGFRIIPTTELSVDENIEISLPGDSGAIWVLEKDKTTGVGLHFEGEKNENPLAEHAIACHLPRVMERLNIELVKGSTIAAKRDQTAA